MKTDHVAAITKHTPILSGFETVIWCIRVDEGARPVTLKG